MLTGLVLAAAFLAVPVVASAVMVRNEGLAPIPVKTRESLVRDERANVR